MAKVKLGKKGHMMRVNLDENALNIIEDALHFYMTCARLDGPDDHEVPEIEKQYNRISECRELVEQANLADRLNNMKGTH